MGRLLLIGLAFFGSAGAEDFFHGTVKTGWWSGYLLVPGPKRFEGNGGIIQNQFTLEVGKTGLYLLFQQFDSLKEGFTTDKGDEVDLGGGYKRLVGPVGLNVSYSLFDFSPHFDYTENGVRDNNHFFLTLSLPEVPLKPFYMLEYAFPLDDGPEGFSHKWGGQHSFTLGKAWFGKGEKQKVNVRTFLMYLDGVIGVHGWSSVRTEVTTSFRLSERWSLEPLFIHKLSLNSDVDGTDNRFVGGLQLMWTF